MEAKKDINRVLHIVSTLDRGGAETLLMNVYRNLDRSFFQFDFVSHTTEKCDYDDEIIKLGGRIYKIPSLGQIGTISYITELKKIMSSHSYVAVHSHTDYQSGFPALAAKLCGIKNRICHAHSNHWAKGSSFKERSILKILQIMIKLFATEFCACSNDAARFLFGKRKANKGQFNLLKNGIELTQFIDSASDSKDSVLQELDLTRNVKIIGHVGRFSHSKNQIFILKVLKKLLEEDSSFVALFIGEGPLKNEIKKEAEGLGILDHIRFLGVRIDISRLMSAFDVFLFPSLFEGFGIVTIEAQSSGTPCVISNTVPKSTDMGLGLISFVDLDASLDVWCREIKEAILIERPNKESIMSNVSKRGYNIQNNVNSWLELYG